jgi:hypothetical protein
LVVSPHPAQMPRLWVVVGCAVAVVFVVSIGSISLRAVVPGCSNTRGAVLLTPVY